MKKYIGFFLALLLLAALASCSADTDPPTVGSSAAPVSGTTDPTEPTTERDWAEWLGVSEPASFVAPKTSAILEDIQAKAKEQEKTLDARLLYVPSILSRTDSVSVNVDLRWEDAERTVLEYYCASSISSSETGLSYLPFVLTLAALSPDRAQEILQNVDKPLFREYTYQKATFFVAQETKKDGNILINLLYLYNGDTDSIGFCRGYIQDPSLPEEIIAEKLYQDFACVPLG
jgi:hypothetical protein